MLLQVGTIIALLLPLVSAQTQTLWGQCGGIGYSGPSVCGPGAVCTLYNPYYGQCTPGTTTLRSTTSSTRNITRDCTKTICVDSVNSCGVGYGGCYPNCPGLPTPVFTPPPCSTTKKSTSTSVSCGSTICVDSVNSCGMIYGGCYPNCPGLTTPKFTPPPCPSTMTKTTTTTTPFTITMMTTTPQHTAPAGMQSTWAQCAGQQYTGPTFCEPGSFCLIANVNYGQCLPDSYLSSTRPTVNFRSDCLETNTCIKTRFNCGALTNNLCAVYCQTTTPSITPTTKPCLTTMTTLV